MGKLRLGRLPPPLLLRVDSPMPSTFCFTVTFLAADNLAIASFSALNSQTISHLSR